MADIFIDFIHDPDLKDYATDDIPPCPKCGAKAFVNHDVVDGFDFGYSCGCPRFRHEDGVHGTNFDTPDEDTYTIFCLPSKEAAYKAWRKRVKHLKGEDND